MNTTKLSNAKLLAIKKDVEKLTKIKDAINQVYCELKDRQIHPTGTFDNGGRWYTDHADLISCRTPSRAWPYSEMVACRTKKYVKKICEKFDCKTVEELRGRV